MDDIEKIIVENKVAFQKQFDAKESLWSKIESELPQEKKAIVVKPSFWKPLLKIAAILVVISSIGFSALLLNNKNTIANNKPNELQEINAHYVNLINAKYQSIENNNVLNQDDKIAFENSIAVLEKESKQLFKELNKNFNNQLVLNAIVRNYKERLRLLDHLLNRIEKSKKGKNEKGIII